MTPVIRLALTGLILAALAQPRATEAATVTYNLTGGAAQPCPTCSAPGDDDYSVNLSPVLSGFTLNVGDRIDGTVTLSTPLTIPAATGWNGVVLFLLLPGSTANSMNSVTYTDSVSFYDNGQQVTPPTLWAPIQGTTTALLLGAVTAGASGALTFDKLTFDSTITGLTDQNNNPLNSVNVPGLPTFLTAISHPVPLPATAWLLLSGIAAIGVATRTHRRPHPGSSPNYV